MPPKVKITKEKIVDAAFTIARKEGADKITARSVSEQLNCSTQPVLYHFSSVEEIKRAVYEKADEYHTSYIMDIQDKYENPMVSIGINYIRFAMEEGSLFRFLFQSNEFSGKSMLELMDTEDVHSIIAAFQQEIGVSISEAKEIFVTLFIFIHGYASLYANNSMIYDEKNLMDTLTKVFYSVVHMAKEDKDEETI